LRLCVKAPFNGVCGVTEGVYGKRRVLVDNSASMFGQEVVEEARYSFMPLYLAHLSGFGNITTADKGGESGALSCGV